MNKTETKKNKNHVEAVLVAVSILDELAQAQRAMGVTELADSLGETKPRIHRHLATLKESGIVEQDQSTERYRLGWRVFQLGEAAGAQFDLRQIAEPYLIRIRDEIQQTAVLAVPINGQAMVVSTADNIYARIYVSVKPGNRPVSQGSAIGRVTLAFSNEVYVDEILSRPLEKETEYSLTDPKKIKKRLEMIKEQFFDFCDSEVMLGINTVAVPVFRDGDKLAAVLGIVGSIQNITNPPKLHQVEFLQKCAAEISELIKGDAYDKWQQRRKAHQVLASLK